MKIIMAFCLSVFTLFLTACDTSSDVGSSFIKELTRNGQIYICRTQKAADACERENNQDCSKCEAKALSSHSDTNTPVSSTVISTACLMSNETRYQVTQEGCVLKLTTGQHTAVCNGSSLKIMPGTSLRKEQLIAKASTFSGNLVINGYAIQCV